MILELYIYGIYIFITFILLYTYRYTDMLVSFWKNRERERELEFQMKVRADRRYKKPQTMTHLTVPSHKLILHKKRILASLLFCDNRAMKLKPLSHRFFFF